MKLTDELKKKIDDAKSEEEVKAILGDIKNGAEEAGILLEEEELDKVAGGKQAYNWGRSYMGPVPF